MNSDNGFIRAYHDIHFNVGNKFWISDPILVYYFIVWNYICSNYLGVKAREPFRKIGSFVDFTWQLKGCPSNKVEQEVEDMLVAINLTNKRKAASKTLSGGMKRKLSVGIALIAGSKVWTLKCSNYMYILQLNFS